MKGNNSKHTSRVETKILLNNEASRTVVLENVYYVLLRNLGKNDAKVVTSDDQEIFLPTGGESVSIIVDQDRPLWDEWKALFPAGETEIHVLYTYSNPVKKLL